MSQFNCISVTDVRSTKKGGVIVSDRFSESGTTLSPEQAESFVARAKQGDTEVATFTFEAPDTGEAVTLAMESLDDFLSRQ